MIGTLIGPKIGLGMIKKEVEKQTGLTVKDFSINYFKKASGLKFKITDIEDKKHEFPFHDEGDKLGAIISQMIQAKLDEKIEIDAFVISYINKEIKAQIYFRNASNVKCFTEIDL